MELALPKREWWGARRSASARGRPWRRLALLLTELRIDVDFQMPGRPVADELARLNERLRTPGDVLHGCRACSSAAGASSCAGAKSMASCSST